MALSAKALKNTRAITRHAAPREQLFAFVDDLTGGTRIRVINGKLTRSGLFGQPETIFYVGKTLFRGEKEPRARLFFLATGRGDMAVAGSGTRRNWLQRRSSLAFPFMRIAMLALCLFLCCLPCPYAPLAFLKLVGFMRMCATFRFAWCRWLRR